MSTPNGNGPEKAKTPEEIEADAARVEAWHATGADRVP